jgi:hypothetical protein
LTKYDPVLESGFDKIYISDLFGRLVYSSQLFNENDALDLNTLQAGEYLIILTGADQNKRHASKLIIKKDR